LRGSSSARFADHAETLTGRSAEDHIDFGIADARVGAYVGAVDIRDTTADRSAFGKIEFVDRAVNRIVLHRGGHVEPGLLESKTHPAGAGKEVDAERPAVRCHRPPFYERLQTAVQRIGRTSTFL